MSRIQSKFAHHNKTKEISTAMLGSHRYRNYLTKTLKQLLYFPTTKTEETLLKNTESLSKQRHKEESSGNVRNEKLQQLK